MNELIVREGPIVVHSLNVLDIRERKVFRAEHGLSIRQLRPKVPQPVVIMWNGHYVLPEDEDYVPRNIDHLVYMALPLGGQASQIILGVILIVVGAFTSWAGGGALIAAGIGLLVSGLVPVPKVPGIQSSISASPTYNIQLSGNAARLGQSIPVVYGRHIVLPDFAAQPYMEYDANGDQYYFANFCLGHLTQGEYTLESIQIDDTDLSHFVNVQSVIGNAFADPDFVGPSPFPFPLVDSAVVTNTAVANNTMVYGTLIGPFVVCGPGLKARHIGLDIVCPKGLYHAADDGSLQSVTVHWLVEARTVDDFNAPTGIWTTIGSHALTGASATPIRRSYKYNVTDARYEVRVSRLEAEQTDSRYGAQLQWAGLRAYLTVAAPLDPRAMYLQLKIKADSQLSGLSQRQISVVIQRWLPTWNPDTGWSAAVYTRSPAWIAADIIRNTDYGGAEPDDRIDLQTLYDLDQVWKVRGDTCNIVFDTRTTIWSALQTVLSCGRARPLMRASVFTFVRDDQRDLPVAMYTMRNIQKGSFNMGFSMVTDETADGIEMQFFNEATWASDYVRQPVPGVDESLNPAQITVLGISNKLQAQREVAYMVADAAYRRITVSFTTEMEGYLPAYGDLIAVSHDVPAWGLSGDFVDWTHPTAVASEDLAWGSVQAYCMLISDQGDPIGPLRVNPGPDPRSMTFVDSIDPDAIYTGTDRERTRYCFGTSDTFSTFCKITRITPASDNTIQILSVVEDNLVHTADGSFEGDGNTGGGTGGGGTGGGGGSGDRLFILSDDTILDYDSASDAQRAANGFLAEDDNTVGTSHDPGYKLS